MRPFLSIGIPTYEMNGNGIKYLSELLESINNQTFHDFEIIISDHSKDFFIRNFIFSSKFNFKIKYYRNENKRGNPSNNINNILEKSSGKYIKLIFQDDLLNGYNSLETLVSKIKKNKNFNWVVSGSINYHEKKTFNKIIPYYNKKIHLGYNTISSPSVLTLKNDESKVMFDENYKWLLDCIYYKDCYLKFGKPLIIDEILIINRISKTQLTNLLSNKTKFIEKIKSSFKYDKFLLFLIRSLEVCLFHLFEMIINIKNNVRSK